MIRLLAILLLLPIICNAQKGVHGLGTLPIDTGVVARHFRVDSTFKVKSLSSADTQLIATTSNGTFIKYSRSNIQVTIDTSRPNGKYASKYYVDSLNGANGLQAVTNRDSTTTWKISASKFNATNTMGENTPDGAFAANRTMQTLGVDVHSFVDNTVSKNNHGFCSFDAHARYLTPSTTGSETHVVDFQSRGSAQNSGSMPDMYAFYSEMYRQNGNTSRAYSFYGSSWNGNGTIDSLYGLYIPTMVQGTNMFAIRTESNSVSLGDSTIIGGARGVQPTELLDVRGSILSSGSLKFSNSSYKGSLVPTTLTADRTYTLPNSTGTIALTSDIPASTAYIQNGTSQQANTDFNIQGTGKVGGYLETDTIRNTTTTATPIIIRNHIGLLATPYDATNVRFTINPSNVTSISGTITAGNANNMIDIVGRTNGSSIIRYFATSTSSANGIIEKFYRNRASTYGTNTALNAGNIVYQSIYYGSDGTTTEGEMAGITVVPSENFTSTAHGGTINFSVTPKGSTTNTTVMSISDNKVLIKQSDDGSGNTFQMTGNAVINGAMSLTGKLSMSVGSNTVVNTAMLSAGTVTVSNTSVTASSKIFVTAQTCSSCGAYSIGTITAGTSFVINSTNGSDASTVAYWIIN